MSPDDGFPTESSVEQRRVEREVLRHFSEVLNSPDFDSSTSFKLNREAHVAFLKRGLTQPLHASFISLEASRPWIIFWILHSLDLLGERDAIVSEFGDSVPSFLARCQDTEGGFGGGPYQIPHLAASYAAVCALVTIGTPTALQVIDRAKMKAFILRMKDPHTGGFRMHQDGEIDMRGTYCAIAVGSLLHMLDDDLTRGVGEYVASCQTYEGGIAGEPGMEAHGGYAYCGLAALSILGTVENFVKSEKFLDWLCRRQMSLEGGFQGRANKLVDSCYTFWQGACFPLLAAACGQTNTCSPEPAQMYVLLACQSDNGGLRDKPGKQADFYHSCYSLSGLAALQTQNLVVGDSALQRNCVYYNVCTDKVTVARLFFSQAQPFLGIEGVGVERRVCR